MVYLNDRFLGSVEGHPGEDVRINVGKFDIWGISVVSKPSVIHVRSIEHPDWGDGAYFNFRPDDLLLHEGDQDALGEFDAKVRHCRYNPRGEPPDATDTDQQVDVRILLVVSSAFGKITPT